MKLGAALTVLTLATRIPGAGERIIGESKNDDISSRLSPNTPKGMRAANDRPKAPDWVNKLNYVKGDDARTLKDYSLAVSGDYTVTSNKNAQNPETFLTGPIMVFGEVHTEPKLSSIRNPEGKGAVLLESDRTEFCLPEKYNRDPSNVCAHIDTGKANIQQELQASFAELAQTGKTLVDLIQPNTMNTIMASQDPAEKSAWPLLMAVHGFVDKNFMNTAKTASPSRQANLNAAKSRYDQALQKNNNLVASTSEGRETAMAKEAIKVIESLDDDAAATVIVGDLHSLAIAQALIARFPEKAVVLCKPTMRENAKQPV